MTDFHSTRPEPSKSHWYLSSFLNVKEHDDWAGGMAYILISAWDRSRLGGERFADARGSLTEQ